MMHLMYSHVPVKISFKWGLTKAMTFHPERYIQAVYNLPFETETPGNDRNIFRQAHRPQHFWSKHSTVPHLHPLTQLIRVTVHRHFNISNRKYEGEGARGQGPRGTKRLGIASAFAYEHWNSGRKQCCVEECRLR